MKFSESMRGQDKHTELNLELPGLVHELLDLLLRLLRPHLCRLARLLAYVTPEIIIVKGTVSRTLFLVRLLAHVAPEIVNRLKGSCHEHYF